MQGRTTITSTIFSTFAFLFLAQAGLAQQAPEEQKQLRNKHRDQVRAIRNDSSLSRKEKKAGLRGLREARKAQLKEIGASEKKPELRKRRGQGRKGGRGGIGQGRKGGRGGIGRRR